MTYFVSNPPPQNYAKWISPFQNQQSVNSTLTPTAGRIHLNLIQIDRPTTIDGIAWTSGAGPAGNVRVAIYASVSETTATGATLVVESADTVVTANFDSQIVDITPTTLSAGLYWIAISWSSTTPRPYRNSTVTLLSQTQYIYDQTYGAMPSTMPAVTATGTTPLTPCRCDL